MKGLILQQQQQQLLVEENMSSNLTNTTTSAASGEGILSSSLSPHNQSSTTTLTSNQTPSVKRKRSLPGNPDPDSEVIALSPKTLMATNRFVCEICSKGFQRDQNLQLHRRGHNLPWKLKQRNNKEVIKKKVYVCPEVHCVHHDPSRALGDLTGIKKHFSRKHGEKKWKCEKCSKKYAVQSDWKAHSKTCGTREYRCDCGTLFSRRDSFITHRAFCDALAEETARTPTISIINPLQQHQQLQPQYFHAQQQQHFSLIRPEMPTWLSCPQPIELPTSSPSMYSTRFEQDQYSQHQTPTHENNSDQHQNKNYQQQISSPSAAASLPHMSATALLQKAAQMGATISKPSSSSAATASLMNNRVLQPHHSHMSSSNGNGNPTSTTSVTTTETGFGLGLSSHEEEDIENGSSDNNNNNNNNNNNSFIPDHGLTSFDDDHNNSTKAAMTSGNFMDHHISAQTQQQQQQQQLQDMMNSLSSASGGFDISSSSFGHHQHQQDFDSTRRRSSNESRAPSTTTTKTPKQNDGMTRDFLGLRAFSHTDILNMNMNMNMNIGDGNKNFDHHLLQQQQCNSAASPHHFDHHHQLQNQNTKPWQQ
ncbi:hypothetical protein MKW92_017492 [Papaver armeniacum]|nr:hypothetical protein MKW92_017492 [Papaver armeniacum]